MQIQKLLINKNRIMAKERMPLGLINRKPVKPKETTQEKGRVVVAKSEPAPIPVQKVKAKPKAQKGRPSTKKGKKLVKYSMDIHPELKRAVVKAAAIYDKDVHVMWNEIVFAWLEKEKKKNPGWFNSINVKKTEL